MTEDRRHTEPVRWTAERSAVAPESPTGSRGALVLPADDGSTRLMQGVEPAGLRAAQLAAARASWAESLYPQEPRIEPRARVSRLATLIRRGRVAGALAAIGVWAAVAAWLAFVPPSYESSATLLVDTRRLAEISSRYGSDTEALGAFGGGKLANQAEIVRIAPVIADTTATRLLASVTAAERGFIPVPAETPSVTEFVALWLKKSAVEVVAKASDDEADMIEIHAEAGSAELAARIADTYARTYVELIARGVRDQRERALAFHQDRVTEVEGELAGIDERLSDFYRDAGTLAVSTEAEVAGRHVSELRSVLDEAQIAWSTHSATLEGLEAELAQLNPDALSARVASSADAEIRSTQTYIADLELRIGAYYTRTPSLREDPSPSPDLVHYLNELSTSRARLDELSRQLVSDVMTTGGIDLSQETGGRSYLLQLRQRIAGERVALAAAEAKRDAVRRRLGAFESSRQRYSQQAIPFAQLQRDRQVAEQRYVSALQGLTALQLDDPGETVRLLAHAEVPREPAGPEPLFLVLFGAFVGLLVGGGVAYGRSRLDDRIYGPEEVEPEGLAVDGVLPDVTPLVRRTFRGATHAQLAGRPVDVHVVTVTSAHTPEAALLRKFATRLAATSARGSVFLFTSAEAGAGKSLTAASTATALALAGFRTLLVDADTYRTAQRGLVGFSDGSLFDVEAGAFPTGGGLESRGGALRLLYGITLYSTRPVATEHLAVHQLGRLIAFYRSHFDYLVVDTPPVMATAFTLAAGSLADRRFLVAASGSTRLGLLRQARGEMAAAGAPVSGVIVNRFDAGSSPAYRSTYQEIRGYYGIPGAP